MNVIVQRTCTVIPLGDEKRDPSRDSRPLSEFRDAPAYVLLGDPGSGKTTAFETECQALGEEACKVDARDFIALDEDSRPERRDKTLFIDGLDEVRAGAADARTPFDQVRKRLDVLGRPRFRLSCREADWLGDNDRKRLETVSPGDVTVLRLDPLTEMDIVQILEDVGVEDPRSFMESARERRIDGLLQNPLTLELLATVIARNERWPESRRETFEKACLQLVSEQNKEHVAARQPGETDELMDAAGRLCAVQLISGIEGYTRATGDPDSDFPSLLDIQYENPDALKSVLSTKLFKAETGSLNRFCPIHRHVAEYLGARYLAHLIEGGLSVRRILALITGEDGIVVTGLRGLSAWLAAHCKRARAELIERDPVGVGLYGDIRGYAPDERRALLKSLKQEVCRLGSIQAAPAFSPLATREMEYFLKDILSNASRDSEHQMFVSFVLRFLREGSRLQGLSRHLLDIVRDESRWPGINELALNAFIHCEYGSTGSFELQTLLNDIHDGIVADPDHELLGILLWHLYPQELPPIKVWYYLRPTNIQSSLIGYYKLFWSVGLTQKSTDEQVVALLNGLRERRTDLGWDPVKVHFQGDFPLRLLARGLQVHGDHLDTRQLYDWLDSGLLGNLSGDGSIGEIRIWLEQRPGIQKKVIIEGLNRCPQSDDFRYNAFSVQKRLFGAELPADFGHWCLRQAAQMTCANPSIADHLLELAWRSYTERRGNKGLSLQLLKENSRNNKTLMSEYLDQLRVPGSDPRGDRVEDRDRSRPRYIDQRREQKEQWLDQLRSNVTALRENRAAPILLHEIARIYFGNFHRFNAGDAPGALAKRLRGESGLTNAAFIGLRGTIERQDIPDLEEIIRIRRNGRMHALCWPFLAGMAEAERMATVDLTQWDKERIRTAITFYYCTPHGDYRPEWYNRLLEMRPEIVADVQIQFARSELRSRRHSIYKLWELARDPAHAQVARLVSLPLLSSFPTRSKTDQIEALDHLLWSSLRYADRTRLQELIAKKLSAKSMNIVQRSHWLAAGVVVSSTKFGAVATEFVKGQEDRTRQVVGFFFPQQSTAKFMYDMLERPELELFIRLIGSYVGPRQRWGEEADDGEGGRVGAEMQAAWLVDGLIQRLAGMPEEAASVSLDRLLEDNALSDWHDVLLQARDTQRVIRRDADYHHPDIKKVCRTLDSRSPANAADLAALLVDMLDEIARQIQTGNTDDWRQYWNEDSHGRPCKPKAENSCRDALLSDLRQRLPNDVDAQPEGQYARDTRADIRVSSGQEFQVPIEIKKNNHPDLWNAIRTQLIAKYTREPAAAGQGIYLVFWFGEEDTQPDPSGTRPGTPGELRAELEATLSDEEARRISVCVIDVSGKSPERQED